MPFLLLALIVLVAGYGFFALFAWFAGDRMLFQPRAAAYDESLPGLIEIPGVDGVPIMAVHLPNPAATFTVLHFHGNAEDVGNLHGRYVELRDHGFAVLAVEYRGYGLAPGEPTEASVYAEAARVFRYVTETLGVSPDRVILYGRSLGSGPAVDLASRGPVAGLILQNAFTSAFRTVTGVPLLPWDRFPNLRKMPRVRCPVLVFHGGRDRTVPFSHGEQLFAAAPEPKRSLWLPDAGHNNLIDVAGKRYWDTLAEFVTLLPHPR